MIPLAAPEYLWLFVLVPALAALAAYSAWRRRGALARFAAAMTRSRLSDLSTARRRLKTTLVLLAVLLAVLALTQPHWGRPTVPANVQGRDLFILVDVSKSMLAEDAFPNRLERAREAVRDLAEAVRNHPGHRLGLIAFAGRPVVKCPLTHDYPYFLSVVDDLTPDAVREPGSMIGDAVLDALARFEPRFQNYQDIILLSDGEDHGSDLQSAASAARDAGVAIYTVGLGDPDVGERIPMIDRAGRRTFLTYQGREVSTKLHEDTLRQLADATRGQYIAARTRPVALGDIFAKWIEPKERREHESRSQAVYEHRYQWFLAPAVALLIAEYLTSDRRRRNRALPTLMARSSLAAALCLLLIAAGAVDPRRLTSDAHRLYAAGRYAEAHALYAHAEQALSDEPRGLAILRFNRAAALYQERRYAEAAELYRAAAENATPDLAAKISYALGNARFKQAIDSGTAAPESLGLVRASVQHYRDCLRLEPNRTANDERPAAASLFDDARHNLDLARRFLDRQLHEQARPEPPKPASSAPAPADARTPSEPYPDTRPSPDAGTARKGPTDRSRDSSQQAALARAVPESSDLSTDQAEDRLQHALERIRHAQNLRLRPAAHRPPPGAAPVKDW